MLTRIHRSQDAVAASGSTPGLDTTLHQANMRAGCPGTQRAPTRAGGRAR